MSEHKKPPAAPKPPKAQATTPDGHLRPDLQHVQASSKQAPEPAPVKLTPPPKDDMGQPAASPPSAPAAPAEPAPRFVHPNHRAPAGLKRYRVRVDNMGTQPTRYVLAAGEAQAKACYLEGLALDKVLEAMGEDAPEPRLVVQELPD